MAEQRQNELVQLAPDGFIMIRSGIREHVESGRFTGYDFGIYNWLHVIATWKTGICYTNAVAIGNVLKIPSRSVNDSLARLRELGYINYPHGNGHRGGYLIYIHKYRCTLAALRGYELNAFDGNDFKTATYTHADGRRVEAAWKPRADRAETALMLRGDRALVACIQDSQDGFQAGAAGQAAQDRLHGQTACLPENGGQGGRPSGRQLSEEEPSPKVKSNSETVTDAESQKRKDCDVRLAASHSAKSKREIEKERWLAFVTDEKAGLPDTMKNATPTDEERTKVLAQLDAIVVTDGCKRLGCTKAEMLGQAISDWEETSSPPIRTLDYHRWGKWLETGNPNS